MKASGLFNVITTKVVRECGEFYTRFLGFESVADLGWYIHLRHPCGAEIAFMEPDHPTQPPIYQPAWTGQGLILSLEVPDARAAYQEAKAQNMEMTMELKQEEWGQLHFGLRDPNGIPIDVVQHLSS